MKILLAIPSARYIEVECFAAIYKITKPKGYKVHLFIPNSYSIDVSRNKIAQYAIENKYDYIFWVDSDVIVPKDTLKKLLSHNKDIVSGVYAYKIIGGKNAVVKKFDPNKNDFYNDVSLSEIRESKDLMKVDAFGFGCVLTKTEVLKNIDYPQFIYTADMGEDVFFCRKAQNAGYELFTDPTILCGHKGEVNYNIK